MIEGVKNTEEWKAAREVLGIVTNEKMEEPGVEL